MKLPRPYASVARLSCLRLIAMVGATALACGPSLAADPPPPMPKGRAVVMKSSDEIPAAKLADDLIKALHEAREVTLISLEPEAGEHLSGRDTFHGRKMMGQTQIKAPEDRQALATALEQANLNARGLPHACFFPHHGLQLKIGWRTYELVICFMCERMSIHTSWNFVRSARVSGRGEIFDQLLSAAKVPLSQRPH